MTEPALRLLHLTDTHLFAGPEARLRGVDTGRTLERVLACALDHPRRADAILVTGDISQDETAGAYIRFRDLLAGSGLPVWCVAGNHDAPATMAAVLGSAPFHLGGCLVHERWAVLLADSHLPGEHGGRLAPGMLARLATLLEEHRHRHVLLAIHHHVLPLGSRWLDDLALHNAAELLALVERAPQLRCVLAGHVHQASDIVRDGVRFLTTPATCFQFLPGVDSFAVDTRPPGCRWLDLHEDGSITTEVAWVSPG